MQLAMKHSDIHSQRHALLDRPPLYRLLQLSEPLLTKLVGKELLALNLGLIVLREDGRIYEPEGQELDLEVEGEFELLLAVGNRRQELVLADGAVGTDLRTVSVCETSGDRDKSRN